MSVSVSGNPAGFGRVREGLSTSRQFQSKAQRLSHSHTFWGVVSKLCAIVSQVDKCASSRSPGRS